MSLCTSGAADTQAQMLLLGEDSAPPLKGPPMTPRHLSCEYVDSQCVSPFLACHLIALNKWPGVHPIALPNELWPRPFSQF